MAPVALVVVEAEPVAALQVWEASEEIYLVDLGWALSSRSSML